MSTALLFPGQGAQRPGMLRHLPDTPAAARTRDEAREILADLADLADLDGGEAAARTRDWDCGVPDGGEAAARTRGDARDVLADLDAGAAAASTATAQLALLVAGVATARALVDDHGLQVDAVAGHSAGAFGAAVLAGVLDLDAALRVVRVRGAAMDRACAGRAWSMAAVRGLGRAAVQHLVDDVSTSDDPLWIANVNAADQIVVAGTRTALDALRGRAPAAGAHDLTDLAVTVASHGPLQAGTAQAVARALAREAHGEQRRAYFANTTGRRLAHATAAVLDDLAQSVRHPVRWHDIVRLMPELGITTTVQVPPGHALSALAAREDPRTTNLAIDDLGIPAALHRLNREA